MTSQYMLEIEDLKHKILGNTRFLVPTGTRGSSRPTEPSGAGGLPLRSHDNARVEESTSSPERSRRCISEHHSTTAGDEYSSIHVGGGQFRRHC